MAFENNQFSSSVYCTSIFGLGRIFVVGSYITQGSLASVMQGETDVPDDWVFLILLWLISRILMNVMKDQNAIGGSSLNTSKYSYSL